MLNRNWLVLGVLPIAALVALSARGISSPPSQHATPCPSAQIAHGQESVEEVFDNSASTKQAGLRDGYAAAAAAVLNRAVARGAYVRISTFGGSIAGIKVICETSTRTEAAAPLFAVAQRTAMKQILDELLRAATRERVDQRTDIYAALVDAVQHARSLQADGGGPVRVYVWSDGDQAAGNYHLRRLLQATTDQKLAQLLVGNQPVPDARGIAITIHGIGRTNNARPAPTIATRRMADVWTLVCQAMHARSCHISPDFN